VIALDVGLAPAKLDPRAQELVTEANLRGISKKTTPKLCITPYRLAANYCESAKSNHNGNHSILRCDRKNNLDLVDDDFRSPANVK
jgi:hypothetical protein